MKRRMRYKKIDAPKSYCSSQKGDIQCDNGDRWTNDSASSIYAYIIKKWFITIIISRYWYYCTNLSLFFVSFLLCSPFSCINLNKLNLKFRKSKDRDWTEHNNMGLNEEWGSDVLGGDWCWRKRSWTTTMWSLFGYSDKRSHQRRQNNENLRIWWRMGCPRGHEA